MPVQGEHFALDWPVPPQASGTSAIVRVEFTDPKGAAYTAYQYETIIVLRDDTAACSEDPDACNDESATRGLSCEPTTTDSEHATGDATDHDIAGCRIHAAAPAGWGALGILVLLGLARSRAVV